MNSATNSSSRSGPQRRPQRDVRRRPPPPKPPSGTHPTRAHAYGSPRLSSLPTTTSSRAISRTSRPISDLPARPQPQYLCLRLPHPQRNRSSTSPSSRSSARSRTMSMMTSRRSCLRSRRFRSRRLRCPHQRPRSPAISLLRLPVGHQRRLPWRRPSPRSSPKQRLAL
jgi:hypothetical protein